MGQITINLNSRGGAVRSSSLPHQFTLEELIAGTVPAGFWTNVGQLEDAFQGTVNVSEGVYRDTTVSFSSATADKTTPTNQTHEEKIVLTLELYAGTPFADKQFKVSVPMPDLETDFTFPGGTDRIMAADFGTALSPNAQLWVGNVQDHYLNYMNPGGTWSAIRALYIDLVGTNI